MYAIDLLMMPINLHINTTLNIKVADYCCIIAGITKTEAIN